MVLVMCSVLLLGTCLTLLVLQLKTSITPVLRFNLVRISLSKFHLEAIPPGESENVILESGAKHQGRKYVVVCIETNICVFIYECMKILFLLGK